MYTLNEYKLSKFCEHLLSFPDMSTEVEGRKNYLQKKKKKVVSMPKGGLELTTLTEIKSRMLFGLSQQAPLPFHFLKQLGDHDSGSQFS